MRERSASFLRGLFFTLGISCSRAGEFIRLIDELLGRLSAEEFYEPSAGAAPGVQLFHTHGDRPDCGEGRRASREEGGGYFCEDRESGRRAYAYGEGLDSRIRAGLEMQEEKEGL